MTVFIISETLLAGGAEWFALRLSDALMASGHEVCFFVLRADKVDNRLKSKFSNIKMYALPKWLITACAFLDRGINRLGYPNFLVKYFNSILLKKYIRNLKPDVLHSHLITADAVGYKANSGTKVRQVATIHGDYIQALKNNDVVNIKAIALLIQQLDKIIIISDEQKKILTTKFPTVATKLKKIYNGYPLDENNLPVSPIKDSFNFGLVARGIPEKGWEPAIQAFLQIPNANVRLYLYCEGVYITSLKEKYTDPRIIYAGFTDNPLAAISNLDVGLLPSYYPSESLPTTIIEYLAMKKPVIATNVGEISKMILPEDESPPAGIIINTIDPAKMVQPLHDAMMRMFSDKILYEAMKASCRSSFNKFSMKGCVDEYVKEYAPIKKGGEACVAS